MILINTSWDGDNIWLTAVILVSQSVAVLLRVLLMPAMDFSISFGVNSCKVRGQHYSNKSPLTFIDGWSLKLWVKSSSVIAPLLAPADLALGGRDRLATPPLEWVEPNVRALTLLLPAELIEAWSSSNSWD